MAMHSLTKSAIFYAVGHIAQIKGTQKHRGDPRTDAVASAARLGTRASAWSPSRDCRRWASSSVNSCSSPRRWRAIPWLAIPLVRGSAGRVRRAAAHLNDGRVRRTDWQRRAGATRRTLPLYAHLAFVLVGRHLSAGRARALVSGHRGAVGMTHVPDLRSPDRHRGARRHRLRRRTAAARHRRCSRHGSISAIERRRGNPQLVDARALGRTRRRASRAARPSRQRDRGRRRCRARAAAFRRLAATIAPAIRLERSIHDLYGLVPEHAPDARPWLDHGRWPNRHPLAAEPDSAGGASRRYPFLAAEGEGLHQIAVGPVHAGIIEPGHFRFTANGETVVRLEERLGYVHKGIEVAVRRRRVCSKAAQLAGRVSGDSTVATSIAFARAVEQRSASCAPARAQWLRALMAELERIANHLGDIGAVCNDAAFSLMHAQCSELREHVLARVPDGVRSPTDDGSDRPGRRRVRLERRGHRPPSVHVVDDDQEPFPAARRTLRRHAVAAGSNGRHRALCRRTRRAVRCRRLRRQSVGPRVRCAPRDPLRAVRRH